MKQVSYSGKHGRSQREARGAIAPRDFEKIMFRYAQDYFRILKPIKQNSQKIGCA